MGADNAAFAIFLGGCNSNHTIPEFKACYLRVDRGYSNGRHVHAVAKRIRNADADIFRSMVDPRVLHHVCPVPQIFFNAYVREHAQYVLHYAGFEGKDIVLEGLEYIEAIQARKRRQPPTV